MADNDILYDATKQNQLMQIFLNRGYRVKNVGVGAHDAYIKEPVYNFEMHRMLFSENLNDQWTAYYQNIQDKLCLNPGKRYGYHLTNDDFYVYMIAHAYKHFSHSGTGLRTLADIYIYELKNGQSLNRIYIDGELKKLGIAQFEEESRELAHELFTVDHLFSVSRLEEKRKKVFFDYCYAGTYGTTKRRIENQLKSIQSEDKPITFVTKIKYCLARAFPGRKWCKTNILFFYKYPVLLPILWVYRIARNLLFRNKKLRHEIKVLFEAKKT